MATAVAWPSYTRTFHRTSYPSISPTRPELSLAGKTVIVTGGGTGIGAAIALSVAQAGASHLAIIGRRSAVLAKTAEKIRTATQTGTHILPVTADLANKDEVDKAIEFIHMSFGNKPLDILVPNAGFFTGIRDMGTETADEWTSNFDINVKAVVFITTAFLAKAAKNAAIINISSAVTHVSALPGLASYAVSKSAGTKFIEYLAATYPEKRVVNVHPGQVMETDIVEKLVNQTKQDKPHIDDGEFPVCAFVVWECPSNAPVLLASLAGDFTVWAASPEAAFLNGKFLWCNWDVDELKANKAEIEGTPLFTTGLEGYSSFKYHA